MTHIIAPTEEFVNFTKYLHHLRPQYNKYHVYEVDAGELDDFNLIINASRYKDGAQIGDPYQLILSKDFFIEDFTKFLLTSAKK